MTYLFGPHTQEVNPLSIELAEYKVNPTLMYGVPTAIHNLKWIKITINGGIY